jgi:mannose-6-phosphate isomerase
MIKSDSFQPQPFQLFNKIQHYDWGTINKSAFIPALLGENPTPDTPYAELWIGTHPKASSELNYNGKRVSLRDFISQYPEKMLGKEASVKFNNSLPYLFKVLSARKALSIQTHPNKEQAVMLHALDPVNYPDDNHKPEIAVALDSLSTLCGFLPENEIAQSLNKYPEIREFAGCGSDALPEEVYKAIMLQHDDKVKLAAILESIRNKISMQQNPTASEKEFLTQYGIFDTDIGLLSFFFFNFVELHEGQGVFTGAGVPHAYIHGNIVECMANSDNVVRAGLTNKFTDVNTLLNILHFDFASVKIMQPDPSSVKSYYNPHIKEFALVKITTVNSYNEVFHSGNKPRLILIIEGKIEIAYDEQKVCYSKGDTVFFPAALTSFTLSSDGPLKAFIVEIP